MLELCLNSQLSESKTDDYSGSALHSHEFSCNGSTRYNETAAASKYLLLEKFTQSGLSLLGVKPLLETHFHEKWKEAEPFADLIGLYWSLRAALGPLLETLILLDRLLLLQEQGSSLEAVMVPIFDPALSPRWP